MIDMAVRPSMTSGWAIGCSAIRSRSRRSSSPASPYSLAPADSSVHARDASRPLITGRRAPATAAAANTSMAKNSTAWELPSL